MNDFIKLIKIYMVRSGRDDFVKYLSEILDISPPAASAKLHGKSTFSGDDIAAINTELNIDPNELATALKRGET